MYGKAQVHHKVNLNMSEMCLDCVQGIRVLNMSETYLRCYQCKSHTLDAFENFLIP